MGDLAVLSPSAEATAPSTRVTWRALWLHLGNPHVIRIGGGVLDYISAPGASEGVFITPMCGLVIYGQEVELATAGPRPPVITGAQAIDTGPI